MNQYIKVDSQFKKLVSLNSIKCIVDNRGTIVIVTLKEFEDAIIKSEKDLSQASSANELEILMENIRAKTNDFVFCELVGRTIRSSFIEDDGAAYRAYVNMSLIAELYDNWEGCIRFIDGTMIESCNSIFALEQYLKPEVINE